MALELVTKAGAAGLGPALADPRLERLLNIAEHVNDLLSKIQTASTYLTEIPEAEDFEEVYYSKNELTRELKMSIVEARLLLPAVDEIISKLEGQKRDLESKRKISLGLAKIEGLSDTTKEKGFINAARELADQQEDLGNTIRAFGSLYHGPFDGEEGPRLLSPLQFSQHLIQDISV